MSVMILEHIKKSFDGREVLKDINFFDNKYEKSYFYCFAIIEMF